MKDKLKQIKSCEVCGAQNLTPVINLGEHPMCDDLVEVGSTRTCHEYPIEILFCGTCRTAHQRFQVPKGELFPTSYHYRSRFTADVLNGMVDLVKSCESRFGPLTGKRVLDIGCNDGSLLDFFAERGATTLGVEPTAAVRDAQQKGHITYNSFFSENLAAEIVGSHGPPDFITFTNVFAHIEDLQEVVRSLKRLIGPQTVIVIENHYLGSVLDGNQFDTFYHEHPRTYSYTSFIHIARSLGVALSEVEFPSRYGGNIRVFLGGAITGDHVDSVDREALMERESHFIGGFSTLRSNMERWCASRKGLIAELIAKHGRLRAKAFPGRAAILIKLLGLNDDSISVVYEKPGSMKIGHYLPGTRVPIRSDDELFSLDDKTKPLLNLAWHIPREIRSYLLQHGYNGPIVDIVSARDFQPD